MNLIAKLPAIAALIYRCVARVAGVQAMATPRGSPNILTQAPHPPHRPTTHTALQEHLQGRRAH